MRMNGRYCLNWVLIGILCGVFPCYGSTNQQQTQGEDRDTPPNPRPQEFVYRPPNRGAPKARIGGGTRGINPLQALAPQHVGLTTSDQPRLYWYLAPGFRNTIRFRLGVADGAAPLLDIPLASQINGGIQRVDLAQHGTHLAPGPVYQWWILLEPLPHQGWQKVVSSGTIQLVTPSPRLRRADPYQRPYLAARQGLWYDAVDGVSQLVAQNPAHWRQQRADLLEQGGLMEAASYDRSMAAIGR